MAPTIMVEALAPPASDSPGPLAVTITLADGSIWRAVATDGVPLPVVLTTVPWSGAQH